MVFQTVPRDDYAPYLIWMAGEGGSVPAAPMCYRVLSVAVALPFYRALPVYRFTNRAAVDPSYLRAAQALAFTSWLALAALAVLVHRIARDRLGASVPASLASFFAVAIYAGYTAVAGVDPLAMLLIAAAYYWLRTPAAFAAVIVASAAFNEKVPLVLGLLLAGRVVAGPREALRRLPVQLLACAGALLGYVAVRKALGVPGFERQLQPLTYLDSALAMLKLTLSSKGMFLNVLPVALCLGAYALVWRRGRFASGAYWSRSDVLVPVGLVVVGTAINVEYTLGRLVMHALPLVMPAVAVAVDGLAVEAAGSPGPIGLSGADDVGSAARPAAGIT
jgi:hypothetical protein